MHTELQLILQIFMVFVDKGCLPASFLVKEEGKQTSWICYRGSLPRLVFYLKEGGETLCICLQGFFPRICYRGCLPRFVFD